MNIKRIDAVIYVENPKSISVVERLGFSFDGKIKNEREVLMTKTEVIQRLQKDLGIPRFQAYIEDKDYSEEEYDQLKKDFEAYFTNYVSNVSADFEGGLDNK